MIFGFNTDVKHGETIYHVQSEAREGELLLQTQVFVRGRCVGKKAISYAASASQAQFGDSQKEQLLRDQHRQVLDAIREGNLDHAWDHVEPDSLSSVKELVRRWYPEIRAGRPKKVGAHRALDDIRESIEELRYYREKVFVPK